jgi:ribosomal protein S12 methylthiotransferase
LIEGIEWIRILYSNPYEITDALLKLMNDEETIAPYLDIPFQHVNKKILKAMGREIKGEMPEELIRRIRSCKRNLSIRTTMMVGFPGETDDEFEELYNFVKISEFDHLGTFVYSPENGTPAARLKGIPEEGVSEKRRDAIMKLQADISYKKNSKIIGKVVPVLVEGVSPETELLLCGRTIQMAPDVDSQVLINKGEGVPGEIQKVRITEAHSYDIIGEII